MLTVTKNITDSKDPNDSQEGILDLLYKHQERTLAIVTHSEHLDQLMDHIKNNGFLIVDAKTCTFINDQAKQFFMDYQKQTYYDKLVGWLSSFTVCAMILEKKNAIQEWKDLMGPTNYKKAKIVKPNSIRALFGKDTSRNATHGSDSETCAKKEIEYIFGDNSPLQQERVKEEIIPDAANDGKSDDTLASTINLSSVNSNLQQSEQKPTCEPNNKDEHQNKEKIKHKNSECASNIMLTNKNEENRQSSDNIKSDSEEKKEVVNEDNTHTPIAATATAIAEIEIIKSEPKEETKEEIKEETKVELKEELKDELKEETEEEAKEELKEEPECNNSNELDENHQMMIAQPVLQQQRTVNSSNSKKEHVVALQKTKEQHAQDIKSSSSFTEKDNKQLKKSITQSSEKQRLVSVKSTVVEPLTKVESTGKKLPQTRNSLKKPQQKQQQHAKARIRSHTSATISSEETTISNMKQSFAVSTKSDESKERSSTTDISATRIARLNPAEQQQKEKDVVATPLTISKTKKGVTKISKHLPRVATLAIPPKDQQKVEDNEPTKKAKKRTSATTKSFISRLTAPTVASTNKKVLMENDEATIGNNIMARQTNQNNQTRPKK
ncbi:MAG: hypothetical protein EXX96DRAFT_546323 [Benjaminiella poitrasii]|nr:MAG: hypothetical protein EXX96DRAFT_546323 [Benjaminiella poitrasii]